MANRYYRKSAVLHESLLTDPSLAEEENNLNSGKSIDGFDADLDSTDRANGPLSLTLLLLLKLALQRLGDWLKDYNFEGVDKWNLKNFAGGKVSSNEDMLKLGLKS
ncbi:hypothetical protein N7524_011304 [Penicillium chrysogenum]|nr:hypothetical protein N7524_011304 [Penicillium chrysogenum]